MHNMGFMLCIQPFLDTGANSSFCCSALSRRTEQLYQNVLSLWHQSHINMKSVASWHYLMADIRAIRNWNVASVCVCVCVSDVVL